MSDFTLDSSSKDKHSALFRCVACEYRFADDLPPMSEDLPKCDVCWSPSELVEVLEGSY